MLLEVVELRTLVCSNNNEKTWVLQGHTPLSQAGESERAVVGRVSSGRAGLELGGDYRSYLELGD